jgi:hypothetical protein
MNVYLWLKLLKDFSIFYNSFSPKVGTYEYQNYT